VQLVELDELLPFLLQVEFYPADTFV